MGFIRESSLVFSSALGVAAALLGRAAAGRPVPQAPRVGWRRRGRLPGDGQEVQLGVGESYAVAAGRPHLVTNAGDTSMTILVLQGVGEYDYVPHV